MEQKTNFYRSFIFKLILITYSIMLIIFSFYYYLFSYSLKPYELQNPRESLTRENSYGKSKKDKFLGIFTRKGSDNLNDNLNNGGNNLGSNPEGSDYNSSGNNSLGDKDNYYTSDSSQDSNTINGENPDSVDFGGSLSSENSNTNQNREDNLKSKIAQDKEDAGNLYDKAGMSFKNNKDKILGKGKASLDYNADVEIGKRFRYISQDTREKIEDYIDLKANLYATKSLLRKNLSIKQDEGMDTSLEQAALKILENGGDVEELKTLIY